MRRSVLCSCREGELGQGRGAPRGSFVCCLLLRSSQELGWALPWLCQSGGWGTPELFCHGSTRTHLISMPWLLLPLLTLPRNSHVQPLKHPWCAQAGERKNVLSFPRLEPGKTPPKSFPSLAKAGISAVQSLFSTLFSIISNSHGTEPALGMVPYHGPSQIKHTPFSPRQGSLKQDSGKKNKKKNPNKNEGELSCLIYIFEYANRGCFLSIGTGPTVDGSSTADLCQHPVPQRKTLIGFADAYCKAQKLLE